LKNKLLLIVQNVRQNRIKGMNIKSPDTDGASEEGYIYSSYGSEKYLKHAVTSVITLRRYDSKRSVAIYCSDEHYEILKSKNLSKYFDVIGILKPVHQSIVGFKHHVHLYMPFKRAIFLDSDIVWCRNPDPLWQALSPYTYTLTGTLISDNFFGAPKHAGFLLDVLFQRRKRTLKRFGLTYLSRVQSGIIYVSDKSIAQKVSEYATDYLLKKSETHFQSRKNEKGRSLESCEWSLAMALSKLDLPVYNWLQGQNSAQLDYVDNYTFHDPDFNNVQCRFYSSKFVYNLRGLKIRWLQSALHHFCTFVPGKGDYMMVTPFCLHFGWMHQKKAFYDFADKTWDSLSK